MKHARIVEILERSVNREKGEFDSGLSRRRTQVINRARRDHRSALLLQMVPPCTVFRRSYYRRKYCGWLEPVSTASNIRGTFHAFWRTFFCTS